MNCAIIKINYSNNAFKFEMIYQGELDKDKLNSKNIEKKYWTISSFNKIYSIPIKNKKNDYKFDKNLEIYIIRHGKGIHNISSTRRKIKGVFDFLHNIRPFRKIKERDKFFDAELDKLGIIQAQNAGDFLKDYLNKNNININSDDNNTIIGASRLHRTRQTISQIMFRVLENNIQRFNIYIFPCIFEISYSTGNCNRIGFKTKYSYENMPKCDGYNNVKNLPKKTIIDCKNILINDNIKISLNWDYANLPQNECQNNFLETLYKTFKYTLIHQMNNKTKISNQTKTRMDNNNNKTKISNQTKTKMDNNNNKTKISNQTKPRMTNNNKTKISNQTKTKMDNNNNKNTKTKPRMDNNNNKTKSKSKKKKELKKDILSELYHLHII
jgi:hypothetical protein